MVRWPPCGLNVSCASLAAESEAGVWCRRSAFGPHGGLGCCPFWGGGSVVVGFFFVVAPVVGVCDCFVFCCSLLCVRSGVAVVLMGRWGLVALLGLSSWCLVVVGQLFLAVPRGCLQFVIVVFPDYSHLLFLMEQFNALRIQCRHIEQMHEGDSTEIFFPKLRSAGLNDNLPSFYTESYCAGGI